MRTERQLELWARLSERGLVYPARPGFKERQTSLAAAKMAEPTAGALRERVLAEIRAAGGRGLTADEVAAALGLSVLSVRPRVTELGNAKPTPLVRKSGARRKNASGAGAHVWVAAEPAR